MSITPHLKEGVALRCNERLRKINDQCEISVDEFLKMIDYKDK